MMSADVRASVPSRVAVPGVRTALVLLAIASLAEGMGGAASMIVAAAFFLAGLAHGTLVERGGALFATSNPEATGYLVVAAAIAAFWLAAPLLGLALFLSLSAWHFAGEEAESPLATRAIALIAVGGSALFQPEATRAVFADLTGAAIPPLFLWGVAAAGAVGVVMVLLTAVRREPPAILGVLALTAVAWLSPVLAVAFVFLALHALPVTSRLFDLYGVQSTFEASAPATLLALTGMGALALALGSGVLDSASAAALLIGLATPHMLVDRLEA
ncbi:Brp/Blh family beta-carotene 15,15'-dioxygenase [Erythrobacter sp.]|jgi:Brp/Blh family beta-carotene 15,15'-monooxygenase|uniref:Brp/Blh family beta-carotene 15,15'-dioxygenase n=1 Tax=Erythrobacter sp. TaxID=1042 RepID=UPI002EB57969|nr:Brp/Blh family beta-carotene 15,15'-dioxygenase [Erythrobacter sp.]